MMRFGACAIAVVALIGCATAPPKNILTGDCFRSRPAVPYDDFMFGSNYSGTGIARITIKDGKIKDVTMVRPTGHSYLDAKTVLWVQTQWVPKPEISGVGYLPVVFRLRHRPI
jgi:hypothetical protein